MLAHASSQPVALGISSGLCNARSKSRQRSAWGSMNFSSSSATRWATEAWPADLRMHSAKARVACEGSALQLKTRLRRWFASPGNQASLCPYVLSATYHPKPLARQPPKQRPAFLRELLELQLSKPLFAGQPAIHSRCCCRCLSLRAWGDSGSKLAPSGKNAKFKAARARG